MSEQHTLISGVLEIRAADGRLSLRLPEGRELLLEPSPQVSARLLLRFQGETITVVGEARADGWLRVVEVRWTSSAR